MDFKNVFEEIILETTLFSKILKDAQDIIGSPVDANNSMSTNDGILIAMDKMSSPLGKNVIKYIQKYPKTKIIAKNGVLNLLVENI